jgi:hypothetical protein
MPKRASRFSVISIYGLEISSPTTSISMRPLSDCAIGRLISSAVRNWLDTSPRTRIGASMRMPAGWICSGGKPSLPR